MKLTEERKAEIINALEVIKKACNDFDDCRECCFKDGYGGCQIANCAPSWWDINAEGERLIDNG